MFNKGVVLHSTEDIDIFFRKNSRFLVIHCDPVYTHLVEVGGEDEGYIEEFTDKLLRLEVDGKLKVRGKLKIKFGEVYCNHKGNCKIVPEMKIGHKNKKDVIIVYRTVKQKIKSPDRLSNQKYFITIKEFLNKYVYLGEL